MEAAPDYLTSPEAALARAKHEEDAILAAADNALATFLAKVTADALSGSITRASTVAYWQSAMIKNLAHPAFATIRDSLVADLENSGLADDAYSAATMAIATAHEMGATPAEREELIRAVFAHPDPAEISLVASLSARVDRWLTRRVQRYLRLRINELSPDDLGRDDLIGKLYGIPTEPSEVSVRSDEWAEDDRPGDLNWRARMQRDIRTSYTRVFGQNMQRVLEKYGFTEKVWVSRQDDRVRHTHHAANGESAGLYGTFHVGGFPLRFPGDPAGPPSEVINCRCVLVGRTRQT